MPITINHANGNLAGNFSSWDTAWTGIKKLQRSKNDEALEESLRIETSTGRVAIGDKCFCKISKASLCRELDKQRRIFICDAEGETLYRAFLNIIDEVYRLPTRKKTRGQENAKQATEETTKTESD